MGVANPLSGVRKEAAVAEPENPKGGRCEKHPNHNEGQRSAMSPGKGTVAATQRFGTQPSIPRGPCKPILSVGENRER